MEQKPVREKTTKIRLVLIVVIVIIIVVQIGPVMGNEEEYILEGRGIGWGSWHVLLSSLR